MKLAQWKAILPVLENDLKLVKDFEVCEIYLKLTVECVETAKQELMVHSDE